MKTTHSVKRRRWTLYFDGDCGICQSIKKWLTRLDVFRSVAWVPYQSLDEPLEGLMWGDFDREVYLDTGSGHYRAGFYAFRMLTLRMLPLMPLAPVLWFPGMSIPGTRFYNWFARNRYRFSRCEIPVYKEDSQKRED